jgi:hypothetical protein
MSAAEVTTTVRHGVVTVTGTMPREHQDLIPLALRLIWDIDGVVDVVNKLGQANDAVSHARSLPEEAEGKGPLSSQPGSYVSSGRARRLAMLRP